MAETVKKQVVHFKVTHPLGMHARVCSRWVKTIQQLEMSLSSEKGWLHIDYKGEKIPANSLFKLLETRIPCGAEFDLFLFGQYNRAEEILGKLHLIVSDSLFQSSD